MTTFGRDLARERLEHFASLRDSVREFNPALAGRIDATVNRLEEFIATGDAPGSLFMETLELDVAIIDAADADFAAVEDEIDAMLNAPQQEHEEAATDPQRGEATDAAAAAEAARRAISELPDDELTREAERMVAVLTEHDADDDAAAFARNVRRHILELHGANAGLAHRPSNEHFADLHARARAALEDDLWWGRAIVQVQRIGMR